MENELEKTIQGMETLQKFFQQFGDDIYAEELLLALIEVLLKDNKRNE
jgi:hypothetical protein